MAGPNPPPLAALGLWPLRFTKYEGKLLLRQAANFTIFEGMNRTQCRMARAALDWTGAELGKAAGVSSRTVAKFELGETVSPETVEALRQALVVQGVEFHQDVLRAGVSYLKRE